MWSVISLLGSTLPGAQPSTKTLMLRLQLKTDLFLITFFAFCVDKRTELAPYSEENVCVCVKCTNTLFWAWQRKSLCSPSSAVQLFSQSCKRSQKCVSGWQKFLLQNPSRQEEWDLPYDLEAEFMCTCTQLCLWSKDTEHCQVPALLLTPNSLQGFCSFWVFFHLSQ